MILVRFRNGYNPEEVFYGNENDIVKKIHELELTDHHDAFFYKRGKFENLGINTKGTYDYYIVCENGEDMKNQIKNYEEMLSKN